MSSFDITKRIESQEAVEITQFELWEVLQSLYEHRQIRQPGVHSPAEILRFMAAMTPPTIERFKEETSAGFIPDYFAGCPMKVTVEYWSADLSQRVCRWNLDLHDDVRVFLGRLDLYDRDNGGEGSAIQALINLQIKKAVASFAAGLSLDEARELNGKLVKIKQTIEDTLDCTSFSLGGEK